MSRFPGWTCLADRLPEPGKYLLGLAGSDDDQVRHAAPCRFDGKQWFNRYENVMPNSMHEKNLPIAFYKELA